MNVEELVLLAKYEYEELQKTSYPNYDIKELEGQYDSKKWLAAMQDINSLTSNGESRYDAVAKTTSGWAHKELQNFLKWMKYYDSGDYLKYKFASLWDEKNPGYFFSFKDKNYSTDFTKPEEPKVDRAVLTENNRKKMLSRLQSLKKILLSKESRELAGPEFDALIEAIYDLEKRISKLQKLSETTYIDLIIREANVLKHKNNTFSSEVLYKFAQINSTEPVSPTQDKKMEQNTTTELPSPNQNITTTLPPPSPPAPPTQMQGVPGNIPGEAPGQVNPGNKVVKPTDNVEGIKGFVNKLQGNIDDNPSEDELYVSDFVVEAQVNDSVPEPISVKEPLNIDPKAPVQKPQLSNTNLDQKIDELFKGITVKDVVVKLEEISQVYKQRELPRQLAIVDMMLSSLNLNSYFEALSEAENRAIESNNYITVRIDEMLSKLRGALDTKDLDLIKKDRPISPEAESVRKNLENQEALDDKKKQVKKDLENQAIMSQIKEEPEITVNENDLNKPEAPKPAAPQQPVPPVK